MNKYGYENIFSEDEWKRVSEHIDCVLPSMISTVKRSIVLYLILLILLSFEFFLCGNLMTNQILFGIILSIPTSKLMLLFYYSIDTMIIGRDLIKNINQVDPYDLSYITKQVYFVHKYRKSSIKWIIIPIITYFIIIRIL